ncbi:MAG: TetR/AcrR family transcriptional regulator [Candidatus Thorarchaeota archaeon]
MSKNKIPPKKTRKEREKESRRNDIINVAERLFLSQGFEDTKMEQIAYEAEFSKGTLYNYFESKDDLYLTIGVKAYDFLIEITNEFIQKQEPGLQQIIAIGYAYYEFTKKYPNYAFIFRDLGVKYMRINLKPENELTLSEKDYLKQSNLYREIFMQVLNEAIRIKVIRDDINPIMIGVTLSSLTSGLIKELLNREEFLNQLNLNSDEIINFVFETIAEGLKPRSN